MNILIVKLNATGDVVRTTTLLHRLTGKVTWITATNNVALFAGARENLRCVAWGSPEIETLRGSAFDLVINLEDETETAEFVRSVEHRQLFGAYRDDAGKMRYTDSAKAWFDLSLISTYGREQADLRKLRNRRTYQDLVFEGLGFEFQGERYLLPEPAATDLVGDVAIAPAAGPVWPMKNWAYYDELKRKLESDGLRVNVLPRRNTLLEHLGDVKNHRCLVGGDSLPMHFALGLGVPCVTIFNCTSPWEICEYGIQTKLVSPLLEKYFYKRGFETEATTAIALPMVFDAVLDRLQAGQT